MPFDFNRYSGARLLPPGTGATLEGLDPAKAALLALMADAVNAEFQEAFSNVTGGPLLGKSPVQTRFPAEASKQLIQSVGCTFPALFVWREGVATYDWFSFGRRKATQTWGIEWILGTFEPDQDIGARNALDHFAALVDQICQLGGHPGHVLNSNENFPAQTLVDSCGFFRADVVSSESGAASFNEDGSPPLYLGCRVMIRTEEISGQQSDTANSNPHEGADMKFTGDAEGDDQEDEEEWDDFEEFIEVASDIEE